MMYKLKTACSATVCPSELLKYHSIMSSMEVIPIHPIKSLYVIKTIMSTLTQTLLLAHPFESTLHSDLSFDTADLKMDKDEVLVDASYQLKKHI